MLNVLDLSGNSLHGKIPSSMSKIKNLGIINLSDNRSSRKIYRHWKGFELLDTLDLSSIEDQSIWWHPKFHVLTTLASSYEIEQQQSLGNFCSLCQTAQVYGHLILETTIYQDQSHHVGQSKVFEFYDPSDHPFYMEEMALNAKGGHLEHR